MAQAAAAGLAGQLRLAFVSNIAYGPLPEWLRSFRDAHPEVQLQLREATLDVQLAAFDADEIDAGFVRAMASDTGARKIVAAIIGLGESLGLPVVAEGIEEQVDVDFLTRLGCDMGQGWLLGRPMPADQARLLMRPPAPVTVVSRDAA